MKFVLSLFLLISLTCCSHYTQNGLTDFKEPFTSYLPDGTTVQFKGNKAYYTVDGNIETLPDNIYLLADLTITHKYKKVDY